jgi:hypothetical protein
MIDELEFFLERKEHVKIKIPFFSVAAWRDRKKIGKNAVRISGVTV